MYIGYTVHFLIMHTAGTPLGLCIIRLMHEQIVALCGPSVAHLGPSPTSDTAESQDGLTMLSYIFENV